MPVILNGKLFQRNFFLATLSSLWNAMIMDTCAFLLYFGQQFKYIEFARASHIKYKHIFDILAFSSFNHSAWLIANELKKLYINASEWKFDYSTKQLNICFSLSNFFLDDPKLRLIQFLLLPLWTFCFVL